MIPENIIKVKGLEHSYNGTKAVDGISFFVRKGEIFSFLGPNGAGKSTVINILTTLLPLQKGSVKIAGCDLSTEPEAVRRSIGIVFQDETLDRDLTVWETLEFHGRIYSLPKEERHRKVEEMMSLVELQEKRDVRIRHLSGGMKRRLEIARGLMTSPQVLFLDEPTLGLDTQTRRRMWEYIKEVNQRGTTIFLTTHYMEEADLVSDWICIIDHGRIVASGKPYDLKSSLGQDVIYLETSDDSKALALLKEIGSVKEAKIWTKGLSITINTEGSRCLPAILDLMRAGGLEIRSVNLKKPTMDDVFVNYTGREMRDSAADKIKPMMRGR
jgi:ABC-2 type transport system ATP-binding protein